MASSEEAATIVGIGIGIGKLEMTIQVLMLQACSSFALQHLLPAYFIITCFLDHALMHFQWLCHKISIILQLN